MYIYLKLGALLFLTGCTPVVGFSSGLALGATGAGFVVGLVGDESSCADMWCKEHCRCEYEWDNEDMCVQVIMEEVSDE